MTVSDGEPGKPEPIEIDPREQMVLDEAQRGIDQQKKDLEELRAGAGGTIGYATVVISVIGGIVLRDNAKHGSPSSSTAQQQASTSGVRSLRKTSCSKPFNGIERNKRPHGRLGDLIRHALR